MHTGFQKSGAYILLGITMNNTPQSKILDAEKTLATTAASKL